MLPRGCGPSSFSHVKQAQVLPVRGRALHAAFELDGDSPAIEGPSAWNGVQAGDYLQIPMKASGRLYTKLTSSQLPTPQAVTPGLQNAEQASS